METMNLEQAAEFLHMSPATLCEKARSGDILAAKPGKRWVFLKSDLVDYLRKLYSANGHAPLGGCEQEDSQWPLPNGAKSGGLVSRRPMESAYADLLELRIEKQRKNSTID